MNPEVTITLRQDQWMHLAIAALAEAYTPTTSKLRTEVLESIATKIMLACNQAARSEEWRKP